IMTSATFSYQTKGPFNLIPRMEAQIIKDRIVGDRVYLESLKDLLAKQYLATEAENGDTWVWRKQIGRLIDKASSWIAELENRKVYARHHEGGKVQTWRIKA
ncbi:MAG: hypothetical protein Q9184_006194, partial [Pyrenodesmia sp. 2 TL-2023]